MSSGSAPRVVVIGAGHNGLVAAAYLAKAGLDVRVLESRPIVGGATVTEEVLPGYRASTCAFVLGLLRPRILKELELRRHGLELISSPDTLATAIWDDAPALTMSVELDRTLRGLEDQFGSRDTTAFLNFGRTLKRIGDVLDPLLDVDPVSVAGLEAVVDQLGEPDVFRRFFTGSVADLLDGEFSSAHLKGFLGFPGIVSVFGGPHSPGTAYVLTHHAVGEFDGLFGRWGFVRGGMGGLASAMQRAAEAAGATVRTAAPVQRVVVTGGRVTGVVLDSGEEIAADVVLSSAEPTRTLLGLVGAAELPGDVAARLASYDVRGSMARVFVAVDELPRFLGTEAGSGIQPSHRGHIFLGPTIGRYERAWHAQERGVLPSDFTLEARIESALDPGLVPGGKHMIVVGVQQLGVELEGTTWDQAKGEFQRRVIEQLVRYAPNLDGHILDAATITPLDLERDYGLTGGNIYHGAMTLTQLMNERPLEGQTPYHTPIDGLYLGGSGTHPGGGVMGAAGRNAALSVLADVSSGGTPTAQPGGSGGRTLADHLLARPSLQRLVLAAAKQPALRPLARRAMRKR